MGPRCEGLTSLVGLVVGGRLVRASLWGDTLVFKYINIYIHIHSYTHTHTQEGGFSIFRGYIWYDTDSDVCLSSSMLRFGLADAPTPLDLALHLYSPKRQRINKFSQNRLFRVGMGEPLNVICRGLDGTPRGGGGARGA